MSGIKIVITGIVFDRYPVRAGHRWVGRMGPVLPAFAVPGACCLTGVLFVLAVPPGVSLSSGEKEDRGNRWVLAAFGVIALLMAFFSSYTDRIGFWTLDGEPCAGWEW